MRQIALDIETTGLSTKNGDRIIEIGCVEIIDRVITDQFFHSYCNPGIKIGTHAAAITGINDDFLVDKPTFSQVTGEFIDFIAGAELIIHNASFDVEFINHELKLLNYAVQDLAVICKITDTLILARTMYPNQRNSLDALCKRLNITIARKFHGALLDAKILAQVFLQMTIGQIDLDFDAIITSKQPEARAAVNLGQQDAMVLSLEESSKISPKDDLRIIYADLGELALHEKYLNKLIQSS